MATAIRNVEQELQELVGRYTLDPRGFVRMAYPWNERDLTGSAGLYPWQDEVFGYIGEHLRNKQTRYTPCRIAISSGHGIGKSAFFGMILGWGLSTFAGARGVGTADTGAQLKTKTVPEVTKWFNMMLNRHWFSMQATSISSRAPSMDRTWRFDFLTWNEQKPEAFQGMHNKGKRIIVLYDEASGIPSKIWEATEGALTDENTQIIWAAYGNPNYPSGRFRDCFGSHSHLWKTWQIDARSVPGTNKALFEEWKVAYGEDSPFYKIRVKGEFCASGINQLIPTEDVDKCRKYQSIGHEGLPLIIGIDVARFGDDRSSIYARQGRKARKLGRWHGLDVAQLTIKASEAIDAEQPDGVVIDCDGLGAGVYDNLKMRGYDKLHEFHGMARADDVDQYFNKRSEAWGLMRDAIKAGMELPDDSTMALDLTGPNYGYNSKQQVQLEHKDDMKARGVPSPDDGDALAMTFGVKIAPRRKERKRLPFGSVPSENAWMG